LLLVLCLVSLPGKSYFFFISQDLVPTAFNIMAVGGFITGLFFSIRKGLSVSDREAIGGIWIWLKEEKVEAKEIWTGAVIPAVLHVLFLTALMIPFILITGSLSGVSAERIPGTVLVIVLLMIFFRSASLFLAVVTGGRLFASTMVTGALLFLVFLGTSGFSRTYNPVVMLLSGEGVYVPACVYGFSGAVLFLLLRIPLKRRKIQQ